MSVCAKVHVHSEQFDGSLHAWCGRKGRVVSEDDFAATPQPDRCTACDRDQFPHGQPEWHYETSTGRAR